MKKTLGWRDVRMNKNMQNRGWKPGDVLRILPVILALAVVPLIVSVKQYDTGLTKEPWFFSADSSIDVFLYWKGQALIVLAVVMAVLLVGTLIQLWFTKQEIDSANSVVRNDAAAAQDFLRAMKERICRPEMVCLLVYLLFMVLSALTSEYRDFAISGSYEQWEGMNVLSAYVVLLLYVYLTTGTEKAVRVILYSLVSGAFVIGLIGTFQFLHMDLFRSSAGKAIMNLMSSTKMNFSFSFEDGWVYATLYNPNYVGSYAALLLPVVIAAATMQWKKISRFFSVLSLFSVCLLTVTLIGSKSLTGCIGVIAGGIFALIFLFPRILAHAGKGKTAAGAAVAVAAVVAVCVMFPDTVQTGWNKLFHPTEDKYTVSALVNTEDGLYMETVNGGKAYLIFTGDSSKPFAVKDATGTTVSYTKSSDSDVYTLDTDGFDGVQLKYSTSTINKTVCPAVVVRTTSNGEHWVEWMVTLWNHSYQIITPFQKLDALRAIPKAGFENKQHFGDKRGYIWSRTFPILKNYIVKGSGPDTFLEAFPNDDYVGKTNMEYSQSIVTKPHNMYLQIWVQTGLVSLIGFLGLFFIYFVRSIRLYFKRPLDNLLVKTGVTVLISIIGYMVTGLANDSTVTVAPVFWGMLGFGMAVNYMVRRLDQENAGSGETQDKAATK